MDLETMQTVYMVAVTGSFSATAEMIPCSQPTISRRIKMAEDEMGVLIFNRHSNHKSVTLTNEGRWIVEKFAEIMREYNELLSQLKNKDKDTLMSSVTLGVAGNTMITSTGIDSLYSDFLVRYPNSALNIVRETEENVMALLNLGKVDFAVLVRYVWNNTAPFIHYDMDERYRVLNFARHDLSVSFAETAPQADWESITMQELEGVPFVYSENINKLPSSTIATNHVIFFEACRMAGFTTSIRTLERHSRAIRAQTVASGLGSTHCALPERLRAYSGIHHVRISDAPIHAEFFLASDKNTSEKKLEKVGEWLGSYFTEKDG